MRATLDIDADVLGATKDLAKAYGTTPGRVISDLARSCLSKQGYVQPWRYRNGFPSLPKRGGIVTLELVDRLRD